MYKVCKFLPKLICWWTLCAPSKDKVPRGNDQLKLTFWDQIKLTSEKASNVTRALGKHQ